ncbi:hypothetical protein [Niveibacterium sp. SC-1]|uniref:BatD family protein n=1 Tax=Niveibacterium sp. SC-1 TaxID=3135646 RepID=UPI00312037EF
MSRWLAQRLAQRSAQCLAHWALLLCLTLHGVVGIAQDAPPKVMLRATLQGKQPVVPGQQVKLQIEALTTTWFLHAPEFPTLDIPGATAALDDGGTSNLNAEIGGVKWFGVSRSYLITPNEGGDLKIPPIEVTLYPGQAKGAMKARTAPMVLKVKEVARPAGAENALASTRLSISQTLSPAATVLKVRDSVTRTVTIDAAGVHAMYLPPTEFKPQDGLAVYPKSPRTQEHDDQKAGFLGSTRVDAATYVMRKAGEFTLPEVSVSWWDIKAGTMRTSSVPAVHLQVAASAAGEVPFAIPVENKLQQVRRKSSLPAIAHTALLVLAGLVLAWVAVALALRFGRVIGRRWRAARARHEASEAAAFARFSRAARQGNPAAAYAALLRWVTRLRSETGVADVRALCVRDPAGEALPQLEALEAFLFADSKVGPRLAPLCRALGRARERDLHAQRASRAALLPPLNPV